MSYILPELVGKFYARAQKNENVLTTANNHTLLFCYCKQPEFGIIFGCDNVQCIMGYEKYSRWTMVLP